jgi:F-type H+-transporting ATPase subunit epsilon
MKLKVLSLSNVLVDEEVDKVVAEAENGSFCLLPRHVDFVASLVPGILTFERSDNKKEEFLAVDEGILVKCGPDVLVSTRRAVRRQELEGLRATLDAEFKVMDEQERKSRAIISKLEVDFARRIFEMRD